MKKETKNNLRIRMESFVIAVNKHLKNAVIDMSGSDLLANMHPSDREFFSINMYNREPLNFKSERKGRRAFI